MGRSGGLRLQRTYQQASEPVVPPESAADVKRMLAATMADVRAGRMDPKVASTMAYVATALLRAYEVELSPAANIAARPCMPSVYRALGRDENSAESKPDIYDYKTGRLIERPGRDMPSALPALAPPTVEAEGVPPKKDDDVVILDY